MAGGAGGKQPDPDEIERRLRELNKEIGRPPVHEPSSLERLVAAKKAEKKAQRKRDTGVLTALAVVFVLLVGGGIFTWLRVAPPSWLHHTAASATPSAQPTSAASHPSPFGSVVANRPPADPFSGTPADGWAAGAAGITIPAARAHGPYTAAQVRSAYEMTRKLLIAGNLDWPTLRGGKPAAFEKLLTKQQRTEFVAGLHTTALAKDGAEKNTRAWVASFAPGSIQFVTTLVKVHGTLSAAAASETGTGTKVLRIRVDYDFVYVIEPPGKPAEWTRIVQQRYGWVDFARWDDPGGQLEPWFGMGGGPAGGLCGERDGYIHPDFPHGPPPSITPSGAPQDPYSLATPSASSGYGCHSVTRT